MKCKKQAKLVNGGGGSQGATHRQGVVCGVLWPQQQKGTCEVPVSSCFLMRGHVWDCVHLMKIH